jgi:glyoxylase-like metal-dependent hydrolase (beta-lactamase superfamily II)
VVIDPGSPYEPEQAALDAALDHRVAAGARVRAVWLTHHHQDHVRGAVRVSERHGAPIAAHPATAARLGAAVPVTVALEDGAAIDLPGAPHRRLSALFTPGHAPGHLCFVEEHTGFVAAGDMVAGVGTILVDPSEGDMAQYLASLARLRAGAPRVLLPSHGGAIVDADARLAGYVRHRLWREERVVVAVRAGVARTPELTRIAYGDVSPAIWPLAERSLIAHLRKLSSDGVVVQEGEMWRIAGG